MNCAHAVWAVLLSTFAVAHGADHLQLVKDTPCLEQYRAWFFTFRRPEPFEPPADFTREQCEKAKRVHERIQLEQAAEAARVSELAAQAEAARAAAARARSAKPGVRIGMTTAQVLASRWGRPDHINRSTYSWGTREQWVYGSGNYLYFRNGILESIHN
jgi:hypothetical protein